MRAGSPASRPRIRNTPPLRLAARATRRRCPRWGSTRKSSASPGAGRARPAARTKRRRSGGTDARAMIAPREAAMPRMPNRTCTRLCSVLIGNSPNARPWPCSIFSGGASGGGGDGKNPEIPARRKTTPKTSAMVAVFISHSFIGGPPCTAAALLAAEQTHYAPGTGSWDLELRVGGARFFAPCPTGAPTGDWPRESEGSTIERMHHREIR